MPRKSSAPPAARAAPRSYSRARPAYRPRRYYRSSTVKRYSVHGRGGYWDDFKARWAQGGGRFKSAFQSVGNALGGNTGGHIGGLLNRALYALTGFGDYKVKKNVLLETNGPPEVINNGKEFIIRHREYITDIYSGSGTANTPSPFSIQSYPINPGQVNTFPWLAAVASKFEQFAIEGMVFEFKSLYSDAVVTQNGSIGAIILATEYNAGAPRFQNKQAMENYEFAQSCKPSYSVLHPIECARSQNVLSELYVRPSALPTGEDIKTYDFGDFQIASQGIPLGAAGAAVPLGELWISYQIKLMKPKVSAAGAQYQDSGYWRSSIPLSTALFTQANPFGTGTVFTPSTGSNITGITVSPTTRNLSIPLATVAMKYLVVAQWYSNTTNATASWSAPAVVPSSNCSIDTSTFPYTTVTPDITTARVTNGCMSMCIVDCPAATASATTAVLNYQTNGNFDQVNGVRLSIIINAVPLVGV